ncbi:hypothetical protein [Tepidibacter hydrothermalis]|uniref:PD-(D/E)XK endonuclease-like domain-containing protein n=1 Tax=Tepidibacter hydrothermalis TaxID=3036126 RepID=A0ABY8EI88_9FIRM|nr:hypothetical protein [Tepidibacter hydrothermalis]WFD11322.1 hypothetical protein P4S50_04390 [Tepidibacter hydrothermalis]
MINILPYTNIKDVDNKIYQDAEIIILAYQAMIEPLKKQLLSKKVTSIGKVQKKILPFLDNTELVLKNIIRLKKLIENRENVNKGIAMRALKHANDFINSIKLLKELNIDLEEYKFANLTDDELFFCDVAEDLLIENSYTDYDIKIEKYKINIEYFKKDFIDAIECIVEDEKIIENLKSVSLNNRKKIILQGFHIITPPQQMLFHFLEKLGFDLIFLTCFSPYSDSINKVLYKTYNEKFGIKLDLPRMNIDDCKSPDLSNIFAMTLEGIDVSDMVKKYYKKYSEPDIEIRVYKDRNMYNQSIIDSIEKEKFVFSTNPSKIDEDIAIFGGDLSYNKRISIKYYPIGIFLNELYSMWDKNRKNYYLSFDGLKKIFESGILGSEKDNAKNYLNDLEYIREYFRGCETLKEWIKRAEDLTIINRNLDIIRQKYGPISISKQRIHRILDYLKEIKKLAETIFDNNNIENEMRNHLEILQNILENDINTKKEDIVVKKLLEQIKNILEKGKAHGIKVNNNYLIDAITVYISKLNNIELLTDDDYEEELDVKKLDRVENIMFENIDEMYLYDINRDSFPMVKGSFTWPLREERIREILKICNEKNEFKRVLIERALSILETQTDATRYMFWMALKAPCKKIMLRLQDSEQENAHFYELELKKVLGINEKQKSYPTENINLNKKNIPSISGYSKIDIKEVDDKCHKYCELKAFYEIMAGTKPFTDKFTMDVGFPNLLKAFHDNNQKISDEDIKKLLEKLCPQYSDYKKREFINLFRHEKKRNNKDSLRNLNDSKINIQKDYNEFIQLKRCELKQQGKDFGDKDIEREIFKGIIPLPTNNFEHCRYCEYVDTCIFRKFES